MKRQITAFHTKPRKPLKRTTKLCTVGKSTATELKKEIQALLRQIVIRRDKKCVLYGKRCHHEYGIDDVVWQAEHLVERSNSATFADSRLVVLVCKNCHGWKHFKKSNHDQYDKWVKEVLPPARVALWETMAESKWRPVKKGAFDWKIAKLALEQELRKLN